VRDAAAMINAAKRPVLYLGGGAINAADEIRQFAEKANLPTTMTLMALGMLPKAHPLSLACWACTARAAPTTSCKRRIC
jgi:acetolactate synthase-1/2/3 large subunit